MVTYLFLRRLRRCFLLGLRFSSLVRSREMQKTSGNVVLSLFMPSSCTRGGPGARCEVSERSDTSSDSAVTFLCFFEEREEEVNELVPSSSP